MRTGLLLGMLVLATGCGENVSNRAVDRDSASAADRTGPTDTAIATVPADEPDRSAAAAASVVRAYYAAIAARDFARAYGLWADSGRASRQSYQAFSSGFAETASVAVYVGTPGRIEGAAGSRYIEIPATVRATTTSGAAQCFRGTYTLRRSEVPGATSEQQQWRIYSAKLDPRPPVECAAATSAADSVRQVVEAFGGQLATVSLLAPQNAVRRDMHAKYEPYVEPTLLESWIARPADAPGRTVSSPWPERIEIERIDPLDGDRYRVTGEVVYVSSTEQASGTAAQRKPVTIVVSRTADGRWLISDWRVMPAE